MVYFFNLLFSTGYCLYLDKEYANYHKRPFCFFGIIILWTIIVGSQFNVGSDYFTYLNIFTDKTSLLHYKNNSQEYLFFYTINILSSLGFSGQFFFYLFAFIVSYTLFKTAALLKIKYSFLFVFLFLCFSSVFHNQFNLVRQMVSMSFFTLSYICFIYRKRLLSILYLLISIGFHKGVVFLLPFCFFIRKFSAKWLIIIMSTAVVISTLPLDSLMPSLLKVLFFYSHYSDMNYINDMSVSMKIAKYFMIPVYLFSILSLNKMELNTEKAKLYSFGIIAYSFRIAFMSINLTSRLTMFFLLISMFPIYYYLEYLYKNNKIAPFVLITLYILAIYLGKILVLPIHEYEYNSIFF